MKTSEEKARQQRVILMIAGTAAVLVAAVIGLTVGKVARSDEADTQLTTKEIFERARDNTLADVREETADQGFEDGRKSGARQGGRAGRRAGEADGTVQAQLDITSVAQAEAANAQAELDSISAPPPTPAAPVVPEAPVKPGR